MDSAPITKRLGQGLSHGDPHIFIGVVIIDMGVAHRIDLKVDQAVAADLMQHVIQEGHAGTCLALARAVQIQTHRHIGFACHPMNGSTAHVGSSDDVIHRSDHREAPVGGQAVGASGNDRTRGKSVQLS